MKNFSLVLWMFLVLYKCSGGKIDIAFLKAKDSCLIVKWKSFNINSTNLSYDVMFIRKHVNVTIATSRTSHTYCPQEGSVNVVTAVSVKVSVNGIVIAGVVRAIKNRDLQSNIKETKDSDDSLYSIGIIVGTSLSIFLIIILLFIICCLCRRKRRKAARKKNSNQVDFPLTPITNADQGNNPYRSLLLHESQQYSQLTGLSTHHHGSASSTSSDDAGAYIEPIDFHSPTNNLKTFGENATINSGESSPLNSQQEKDLQAILAQINQNNISDISTIVNEDGETTFCIKIRTSEGDDENTDVQAVEVDEEEPKPYITSFKEVGNFSDLLGVKLDKNGYVAIPRLSRNTNSREEGKKRKKKRKKIDLPYEYLGEGTSLITSKEITPNDEKDGQVDEDIHLKNNNNNNNNNSTVTGDYEYTTDEEGDLVQKSSKTTVWKKTAGKEKDSSMAKKSQLEQDDTNLEKNNNKTIADDEYTTDEDGNLVRRKSPNASGRENTPNAKKLNFDEKVTLEKNNNKMVSDDEYTTDEDGNLVKRSLIKSVRKMTDDSSEKEGLMMENLQKEANFDDVFMPSKSLMTANSLTKQKEKDNVKNEYMSMGTPFLEINKQKHESLRENSGSQNKIDGAVRRKLKRNPSDYENVQTFVPMAQRAKSWKEQQSRDQFDQRKPVPSPRDPMSSI